MSDKKDSEEGATPPEPGQNPGEKQEQETPEEKAARENQAKKAGEKSTQIVFIVAVATVTVSSPPFPLPSPLLNT